MITSGGDCDEYWHNKFGCPGHHSRLYNLDYPKLDFVLKDDINMNKRSNIYGGVVGDMPIIYGYHCDKRLPKFTCNVLGKSQPEMKFKTPNIKTTVAFLKDSIWIMGGVQNHSDPVDCDQERLTTTSLFMKFNGDKWIKGPYVPFFTYSSTAIHIDEDNILLLGGCDNLGVGVPEHTKDTWFVNLSKKSFCPGPPMLTRRERPAAAKMLLNDKVVIVVAGSSASSWSKYTSSVEILNLSEENPVWKEGTIYQFGTKVILLI